jgi:hypothetical protein
VTIIFNPDTAPQSKFFLASIEAAAPSLGVELMQLVHRHRAHGHRRYLPVGLAGG